MTTRKYKTPYSAWKACALVVCTLPLGTSFVGAQPQWALSSSKVWLHSALPAGRSPRLRPRQADPTKNNHNQEQPSEKPPTKSSMSAKLYMRGLISNGLGAAILWGVSKLDLGFYVMVSASIQFAVFAFHGLPCRSEKFYDLSGSLTHFALVAACLLREASLGDPRSPRQLAMALLSVVWLTRLGTFLFTRIARDGKDGRFDAIKPNWLSFLGAWNLQAAWCVLTQLPVLLVNTKAYGTAPLSVVDGVALGLWCLGFAFECSADLEKFTFRGKPENKGKFITEGVWRYCRHPNYFGEITMWFAMALAATAAGFSSVGGTAAWAFASPAFTALLLLKISGVPMVEAAGESKWGKDPAYRAYMDNTSCILPWFPASKDKTP